MRRVVEAGLGGVRGWLGGLFTPVVDRCQPFSHNPASRNTTPPTPPFPLQHRNNIHHAKAPLYLINNLQITLIVWQKLSAARSVLVEQQLGDVLLAALAAVLLHFVFLTFNVVVTWLARFPEAERKAIIIMASQKNLPTAATIISYFDASVGNLGLITIPCIVFYIMQVSV